MAFLHGLRSRLAEIIAPEQKGLSFLTATDGNHGQSKNLLYVSKSDRDASNNSIVMACTFWAMRNITLARPQVEEETDDGWETIPKHPLSELVRNPQKAIVREERMRMTGARLSECITHNLMFDGNAYLYKLHNSRGQVIALNWIPSHAVRPVERRDMLGVVDYYEVSTVSGQALKISPLDMVHHQIGVDPRNPVMGLSPLKAVMRQVLTDNEIAVYSHSIVRMPNPGLIVSPQIPPGSPSLTLDEADRIAQQITAKASGEKAGGIVVPVSPVTIDHLRLTPDQMAIDKLNSLPEERITAVFGIPAIVAGMGAGLERSTFSNMSEAREAAAEEFLLPMWRMMADTYTSDLLEDFPRPENKRVAYDVSEVRTLTEDRDKLHERVRQDFRDNLLNRAEARVKIGEEPLPGDENTWAYMLRPGPSAPMGLPQQGDAGKARREAEKR